METLLYSLNVTLPVFILLLFGYYLRRSGVISGGYVTSSNRLTFRFLLPMMIFNSTRESDFRSVVKVGYIGYCVCFLVLFPLMLWAVSSLFIRDKRKIGTFLQGSYRGNAAIIGLSLAQNIYGPDLRSIPFLLSLTLILYNMISVVLLSCSQPQGSAGSLKQAAKKIVRNPIIWGSLVGLLCNLLKIQFFYPLERVFQSLGSVASTLSLIAAGGGFVFEEFRKNVKLVAAATFIKLILMPACCLAGAYLLGFRGADLFGGLVIAGVSTATTSVVMARELSGDEGLAVSILGTTTLCAALTLTGWIYFLEKLALL